MPLCAEPESAYILPAFEEQEDRANTYGSIIGPNRNSALSVHLRSIDFGRETYPLWRPVIGKLLPDLRSGGFKFQIQGLPGVLGVGRGPKEAIECFQESFHSIIQSLLAKRSFEMSEDDVSMWNEIRRFVNTELYRSRQPVILRQFGKVRSVERGHHSVKWEGMCTEKVDLAKWPGEFAAYTLGQPFEAYVERDPQTMNVRSVFGVRKASGLRHSKPAEYKQFMRELGSNKDLPPATLD